MQTKQIEKRKLGNSNLKVAPLIFGGNVFGWTVKDDKSASDCSILLSMPDST